MVHHARHTLRRIVQFADPRLLLPYLCVGVCWFGNLTSSFLTEGGVLFTGVESYIKQIRLPYSVYVYRSAWSKLIIFAHNFINLLWDLDLFQNLARLGWVTGHTRTLRLYC